MAQQPEQTNPANSEQMLAPSTGGQHIQTPPIEDIQVKVNPGGTAAQDAATQGYEGR